MEIKDVLSFVFQAVGTTQTFWNFYATIVTAILGFVAAAKIEWLNKMVRGILTAGFAIFALANYSALNQVRVQREALVALIPKLKGYSSSLDGIIASTSAPSFVPFMLFHGALDIAVITMIWVIPYIRLSRGRR